MVQQSSNRMILLRSVAVLTLCLGGLAACSGAEVKRNLGLTKEAPDEFMVLSRPKLSVPPDFTLAPPTGDAGQVPRSLVPEQARAQLIGMPKSAPSGAEASQASAGPAEQLLLQRSGYDAARAKEVRTLLRDEASQDQEEESLVKRLLYDPKAPDPIVDADAERTRVSTQQREGATVTGEGAAVIEVEPPTPLQQIIERIEQ